MTRRTDNGCFIILKDKDMSSPSEPYGLISSIKILFQWDLPTIWEVKYTEPHLVSFRLLSQAGTYPRAGVVFMSEKGSKRGVNGRERSGLRIKPIGSNSNLWLIY